MKKLKIILSLAGVAAIAVHANAQDTNSDNHTLSVTIPELALVDIESSTASKNISMNFTAPIEAGLPLDAPTDNSDLWINYSSIKSVADPTRSISVKLNALLPGVDIKVTAAPASGSSSGGTLGTPTAQLTLTAADQAIINGIGSAYTGDGANNGHNLTYALISTTASYADLAASTTVATVTYTISDN